MTRARPFILHLCAAAFFSALTVAWTWPLALHLSTAIPGHPGDNLAFLWNSWWLRVARAAHASVFQTDLLFAPFGADLTLHTHTALSSALAATLFGRLPLVAAHNLTILLMLAVNGLAAYLLAWRRFRHWPAAIVAGVIFSVSPYLAAHLHGHVNLLSAWGLPLFALCFLHAVEQRSWLASAAAGAVVVATAYNDYYYVVYAAAMAWVIVCQRTLKIDWEQTTPRPWLRRVLLAVLAVDILLVLVIVARGGFITTVAGVNVAATRPTNPLAIAWGLGAALLFTRVVPRVRLVSANIGWLAALVPMGLVIAAGLAPLVAGAWQLIQAGNFSTPRASWRSGPAGVDLMTLVAGNPWHGWFGATVRGWYEQFRLDPIEGVGWLGVVPVVMAVLALRRANVDREVRVWRALTLVFFVWALGPWLRVFGHDTGLLLPQNLIAHLPLVSNARMPGRAMVVVFLGVAMLAAFALSRSSQNNRAWIVPLVLAATLLDFWPAPFPLTSIETPPIYGMLKDLPRGSVCELPVGVRDGFGMMGLFDDRVLEHQMAHGQPIVGGFAARVPASTKAAYAATPVLRSLFRLSGGETIEPADAALTPTQAAAALRNASVSYLVLNREAASAPLREFVERAIATRVIAVDGAVALLEVER